MRILAIDLGDKRTGLALGDDVTRIASPAGLVEIPIDRRDGAELVDALAARIDEELGLRDVVVLGLPVNMDATEGPRAKLVRGFGARIARAAGREVVLVDERKTSQIADDRMARTGLTRGQKKARRDAIAAAAILEAFLGDPDAELGRITPEDPAGDVSGKQTGDASG